MITNEEHIVSDQTKAELLDVLQKAVAAKIAFWEATTELENAFCKALLPPEKANDVDVDLFITDDVVEDVSSMLDILASGLGNPPRIAEMVALAHVDTLLNKIEASQSDY